MTRAIPSQCPECGSLNVSMINISPDDHERGDEWATRVECTDCGEYAEWFD
ncbi:hypothetical protein C491_17449 [Natronococcus amylolyticus DSM 10524]|uniref:Small CPxCG-related zinc finger protein n=1 Tax=Natronococcus amylolyticus DSM 10524 TaxID=1227497 RepID=L9X0Q0_9EURY|nr:hypothetical protein [Natronococcus amylolyticus]ELY54996.1 hypothetical protein C491_17449 [Natronococcus amylolyticus DSM 10524]